MPWPTSTNVLNGLHRAGLVVHGHFGTGHNRRNEPWRDPLSRFAYYSCSCGAEFQDTEEVFTNRPTVSRAAYEEMTTEAGREEVRRRTPFVDWRGQYQRTIEETAQELSRLYRQYYYGDPLVRTPAADPGRPAMTARGVPSDLVDDGVGSGADWEA